LAWKVRKIYDDRSEVDMMSMLNVGQVWAEAKKDMKEKKKEGEGAGSVEGSN
jgi:hypothetical protein